MNTLDFLSTSPNIFIFQKEANKTNFGGVLFLIYIIIMIFISLIYILDYALNEKFEIESYKFNNKTYDEREKRKLEKDEELNPYFDFHLSLKDENYLISNISGFIENDYIDQEGHYIYKFGHRIGDRYMFIILYKCGDD